MHYKYSAGDSELERKYRYTKKTGVDYLNHIVLAVFFLIAMCYRWIIKSTALIYWPFVFFHRIFTEADIKARAEATTEFPSQKVLRNVAYVVITLYAAWAANRWLPGTDQVLMKYAWSSDLRAITDTINQNLLQGLEPWLGTTLFHAAIVTMTLLQIFHYWYAYPVIQSKTYDYRQRLPILLFTFNLQNVSVLIVTVYIINWAIHILATVDPPKLWMA